MSVFNEIDQFYPITNEVIVDDEVEAKVAEAEAKQTRKDLEELANLRKFVNSAGYKVALAAVHEEMGDVFRQIFDEETSTVAQVNQLLQHKGYYNGLRHFERSILDRIEELEKLTTNEE